jgi:hypothetical protein
MGDDEIRFKHTLVRVVEGLLPAREINTRLPPILAASSLPPPSRPSILGAAVVVARMKELHTHRAAPAR